MSHPAMLPNLPLVGRTAELEQLRGALSRAAAGRGGVAILAGQAGVGKTRLAQAIAAEAARSGFTVAHGRAYPMEAGVPYALFADALVPLFRSVPPETLSRAARGGEAELGHLFPGMWGELGGVASHASADDPAEFRTRLLWTLAQVLRGLASSAPLLLVLDDVHRADASSLELLHFLGRQAMDSRVLLLCTYNQSERRTQPALMALESSLLALDAAAVHRIQPLTHSDTAELLRRAFDADEGVTREFTALLYGWTRGNAFFLQATLQSLIEAGDLRQTDGRWLGWGVDRLELPSTVREAVLNRLDRLPPEARALADLCAVIGTRLDYDLLRGIGGLEEVDLLGALDELRRQQVLVEQVIDGAVVYDFAHPMFGQALYAELGHARCRLLHTRVATAMERHYGDDAGEHASELAHHFVRADPRAQAPKAIAYLSAAGRAALRRYASREAADYLEEALRLLGSDGDWAARSRIQADLARARQRLGDYSGAIELWETLLESPAVAADPVTRPELERRIGLALYWGGRHADGADRLNRALATLQGTASEAAIARMRLARAACLQEIGRAEEAQVEIEAARDIAESISDDPLRARTYRALLLLHTWTGPAGKAREHGATALVLAERCGDRELVFSSHWALAVLEGLTGHTEAMAHHIDSAEAVAEELRAPLLSLATAELNVEYCSAVGEWDRGIAIGEQAITLARSLNQTSLLVRLLVWTSLIYLGRGAAEKARQYVDEAWRLSGADRAAEGGEEGGAPDGGAASIDVHAVIPAHIGLAACHMWNLEYREAIRVGEAGLRIAERCGYIFWAIHRLLPIVAESYCHLHDVEGAVRCEARLRRESTRLDHRVGLAWADACAAIVPWISGDVPASIALLREAAESLEAIPVVAEAARMRRQLAGRLADIGDREGSLRELRRVHDIFEELGAEQELNKARGQFREVGSRPPVRTAAEGAEGLTGREVEVAVLVSERKSNKAIAKALAISPRTVSTHLSNVFRKLGVSTRVDLADYVRANDLRIDG